MKEKTKDLEWKDISHEVYRVYEFPDGKRVRIDHPVSLNVSASGGHRITDSKDRGHYIPYKWIHIYWETNDNNIFLF